MLMTILQKYPDIPKRNLLDEKERGMEASEKYLIDFSVSYGDDITVDNMLEEIYKILLEDFFNTNLTLMYYDKLLKI